jgi:hypothetical protein
VECENNARRIHEFRPYGGCPGAAATMTVTLHYKGSNRFTAHHLCTTCSRAFTQHYCAKGHRVRQVVMNATGRRSVWEALRRLWRPRRAEREYLFGKDSSILPGK